MTAVREITAWDATGELQALARRAHEVSSYVAGSLVSLRNAIDREDPGEIFSALASFERSAREAADANAAVISEAVSRHGYF